jgi:hypothetical protein
MYMPPRGRRSSHGHTTPLYPVCRSFYVLLTTAMMIAAAHELDDDSPWRSCAGARDSVFYVWNASWAIKTIDAADEGRRFLRSIACPLSLKWPTLICAASTLPHSCNQW